MILTADDALALQAKLEQKLGRPALSFEMAQAGYDLAERRKTNGEEPQRKSGLNRTRYIKTIGVTDPDTGADVELEVHKDPVSGACFAIEAGFADQVSSLIINPYAKVKSIVVTLPMLELELPNEEGVDEE